jgi:single-strand selective monofunctional uracil DNA glycosylase
MTATSLLTAARDLSARLRPLRFAEPVTAVYNPLEYAESLHRQYLERYANSGIAVLFVGMNPGPFGMAQTGIPFGEVEAVRDWLKLSGDVQRPVPEHPKRPVTGLACPKSEVSGKRLWSLFRTRFGTPEAFFAQHFVSNWCPLAFMDEGGANLTPDKLPAEERAPLEAACDEHLRQVVAILKPTWVIGIGGFARERAEVALTGVKIGTILHPSPASPAANKGWPEQATKQLITLGIWS